MSFQALPFILISKNAETVMKIVEVKSESLEGKNQTDFLPLWEKVKGDQSEFNQQLTDHERKLQEHMVYHLTANHRTWPTRGFSKGYSRATTSRTWLDEIIRGESKIDSKLLQNKFIKLNSHIISLEALWNIYIYQIKDECSVLEALLPQDIFTLWRLKKIYLKKLERKIIN